MPTRALLFDVYGTLLDVHGVAVLAEELFPGNGRALSSLWRDKQLQYSWLRTLANAYVDFWQITGDALDYAAESLALSLTPDARSRLMGAYLALPAYADASPALAALAAKGIARAALSNGSPAMLEPALAHAGLSLMLDAVLSVDATHRYKTAPEAYQLAVDRFGGGPADFVLVSSNGWDVAGAAHFGFRTFWINRLGAPVERLGVTPTFMGRTLADVLSLPLA